jgi:hypothetical protein
VGKAKHCWGRGPPGYAVLAASWIQTRVLCDAVAVRVQVKVQSELVTGSAIGVAARTALRLKKSRDEAAYEKLPG